MAGTGPSSVGSVSYSGYSTADKAGVYFSGGVPSSVSVYYSGTGKTYTATLSGMVVSIAGAGSWTSSDANFSIDAVLVPTHFAGGGSSTVTVVADYVFGQDQLVFQAQVGNVSNQSVSWPGLYTAPPPTSLPSPPTPAAPSNLTISDATSSVALAWTAVSQPSGTTLTYEVQRNGTSIATGLTSATYTDAAPGSSRPITYTVRAKLVGDGSNYSGTSYSQWTSGQTNGTPYAPTLTSPADGAVLNLDSTNRFRWTPGFPTSGDSQSKFDLDLSSDGGTTWTTTTVTSPNSYYDVVGGTFTAGPWQWRARVYGSSGLPGPYSLAGHFTAATASDAPSITAPTAGTYVDQNSQVTWSTDDQRSYQLRRVADDDGTADTSTVYYDTGEVASAGARSAPVTFETNNRPEHVQVRVKNAAGLWSSWADVLVFVAWTPPPAALLAVQPILITTGPKPKAALRYTISTPAPAEGDPAATLADISARPVGSVLAEWSRSLLPASTTVDFETPASGVEYEAQVTTHAENGVTTTTGWMR